MVTHRFIVIVGLTFSGSPAAKIGEIAVPPEATLRDWKDAFSEAQRIADEARQRAGVMKR